jgi:hypothetical protein
MSYDSDLDIDRFVERLLANPPGKPHSITLELDVEGDAVALFEALLTIMTTILRMWYAPPINLARISESDMERLLAYFASFGIALNIETQDLPRVIRINNRAYETKSRLQDMTFQMTNQNTLYTVSFGFARIG